MLGADAWLVTVLDLTSIRCAAQARALVDLVPDPAQARQLVRHIEAQLEALRGAGGAQAAP